MPPPPVVIAANPYEGELCRRALADTGLSVEVAEDREHCIQLVSSFRPLVVVIADGWYHAPARELVAEVRAIAAVAPIFLLADRDGEFTDENAAARAGASSLFLRPIEVESLADAIEKLAVEYEIAGEVAEGLAQVAQPPPAGAPSVELEADFGDEWSEPPSPGVARMPTEVIVETPDAPRPLGAPPATVTLPPSPTALPLGGTDPGLLLRADEVLAEAAGLRIQELATSADFVLRAVREGEPGEARAGERHDDPARAENGDAGGEGGLARIDGSFREYDRGPEVFGAYSRAEGDHDNHAPAASQNSGADRGAQDSGAARSPAGRDSGAPSRAAEDRGAQPRSDGDRARGDGDRGAHARGDGDRGARPRGDGDRDDRAPGDRAARPFSDRSTFARRLDLELSEAERRLFPGSAPAARSPDYEDALGDIDLDSLGVDTLPGIAADALDSALDVRDRSDSRLERADDPPPSPLARLVPDRAGSDPGSARAVEEEGDLAAADIAELVAGLHASGWSGRLTLARGDGEKALFFDGGLPVFATSNFLHDRLGDLLYREGKLTREQHARTREVNVEPGRRTAALFVEQGLVKSRELFPTLRRHVEEILFSCFAWDSGSYRLGPEPAPAEDKLRLSLHPWALVLEGVRRKYGLERLVERVGPPETILTPTTGMERALHDAELTGPERVVAELFDGERSLSDVAFAVSGLPGAALTETQLYALAWGLCAVGAARIGAQGVERVGVRAASTLVTPIGGQSVRERRQGRRDGEGEQPADRAIDRERLIAKRAQLADADYFAILGVDRHASTHEIDRAFERLRIDFAPERFAEAVRAEMGEALDEIRLILDEAHRVLADEAVRHAYREHLVG